MSRPRHPQEPVAKWMPVRNGTTGNIPGGALLRVTSIDNDGTFVVGKPNQDGQTDLLFNSRTPIGPGDYGIATREFPVAVCWTIEPDGDAPDTGEIWGAVADEWLLHRSRPGFRITGGIEGQFVAIEPMSAHYDAWVEAGVGSVTAGLGEESESSSPPASLSITLTPAREMVFDPVDGTWSSVRQCWLYDPNQDTAFIPGRKYHANLLGWKRGRPLFGATCCDSSTGTGTNDPDPPPDGCGCPPMPSTFTLCEKTGWFSLLADVYTLEFESTGPGWVPGQTAYYLSGKALNNEGTETEIVILAHLDVCGSVTIAYALYIYAYVYGNTLLEMINLNAFSQNDGPGNTFEAANNFWPDCEDGDFLISGTRQLNNIVAPNGTPVAGGVAWYWGDTPPECPSISHGGDGCPSNASLGVTWVDGGDGCDIGLLAPPTIPLVLPGRYDTTGTFWHLKSPGGTCFNVLQLLCNSGTWTAYLFDTSGNTVDTTVTVIDTSPLELHVTPDSLSCCGAGYLVVTE